MVPTTLFGAETWNIKALETRLNVMKMKSEKYVWSFTDPMGNEEVRRRTETVRELADQTEQGVLR